MLMRMDNQPVDSFNRLVAELGHTYTGQMNARADPVWIDDPR
jgi:hypothetical protein